MIDYFALLDQPHAPWLDLDKLKDTYHQKTLQTHPDAQTSRPDADATDAIFTSLNEAYQVLQDPKRRLYHLLSLEGSPPPSTEQTVPKRLHDLFPKVGALAQRAHLLLEKIRAISNELSRSLLKTEILELQSETKEIRETLQQLHDESLIELQAINAAWSKDRFEQVDSLSDLYYAFAYLTRWSTQLDEIQFQLSLH
jgi:curved DNA-binding protein CbpA